MKAGLVVMLSTGIAWSGCPVADNSAFSLSYYNYAGLLYKGKHPNKQLAIDTICPSLAIHYGRSISAQECLWAKGAIAFITLDTDKAISCYKNLLNGTVNPLTEEDKEVTTNGGEYNPYATPTVNKPTENGGEVTTRGEEYNPYKGVKVNKHTKGVK